MHLRNLAPGFPGPKRAVPVGVLHILRNLVSGDGMTKCIGECKFYMLCRAFQTLEDHTAPDGKIREILGCDKKKFTFGAVVEPYAWWKRNDG